MLPFSLNPLRILLRERGVGTVVVKKRGSPIEPEQLRRELRLAGPNEAIVILTRVAGAPTVLLASHPSCSAWPSSTQSPALSAVSGDRLRPGGDGRLERGPIAAPGGQRRGQRAGEGVPGAGGVDHPVHLGRRDLDDFP